MFLIAMFNHRLLQERNRVVLGDFQCFATIWENINREPQFFALKTIFANNYSHQKTIPIILSLIRERTESHRDDKESKQ